jgi:hypothetical protein
MTNTADADYSFRLGNSGSSSTTAYYSAGVGTQSNAGTLSSRNSENVGAFNLGYGNGSTASSLRLDVFKPKLAENTTFIGESISRVPGSFRNFQIGGGHDTTTAYDGLSLAVSAGTITGKIQVMAWND